ncbi:MAG TPA: ABC transporter permease [Terracidiphilus sp.]|jgi:predicted permease
MEHEAINSMRRFIAKLRLLFRRNRLGAELDEEMAFHREQAENGLIADGMPPRVARYAAMRQFGNATRIKERSHAVVSFEVETVVQDVRFALRQLCRNPGFALTAIVVLALGIGASVAIFAFVDAALIKPLPYRDPLRLVGVFESNPMGPRFHISYLDYLDYKRLNKVFSSLDVYDAGSILLTTPSRVEHAAGASVSDGFFRTLGVRPVLGRDFIAGEDLASAPRAVLLSYGAWQSRYGGRRDVLGHTVTLNDEANTIVGVLPPGFHFAPAEPAEFWTTLHASASENRAAHWLTGIARLKDGVTLQAAAADMSGIGAQLAHEYPDADEGRRGTVASLTECIVGNTRPILLVLLAGASLLLLIAYVNGASLVLVRGESRRREIAVRGALGATHIRLLRQFVTEGLLLVAAGAGLGVGLAFAAMQLLLRLIPAQMMDSMPYLRGLGLNLRVLGFGFMLSLLAGLLFSLAPVLRLYLSGKSLGMQADLADGGRGSAGTLWRRLGPTLVLVELAMAMVLLTGAGLLGKSFYRLLHTEIGFKPDHLAVLQVSASGPRYATNAQSVALGKQVVDRLKSLPGIENVGICLQLPLGEGYGSTLFDVVGRPKSKSPIEINIRQVSSSYFPTVETRLLRGRFFTDEDDASKPLVMIINQALAQKYFPGEDPIGKRIITDDASHAKQIVGIVEDVKEGPLDVATKPVMYEPYNQDPDDWFVAVVRTAQSDEAMLPALTAAVHQIDASIAVFGETTMSARMHDSPAAYLHRSSAWLVGGFAAIALVLGTVGLYGVIAYSVSLRMREIGVRMALGAQRGSVYRLILREAAWLVALGVLFGLAGSMGSALLMGKLLFGVQAWDAETLVGVAVLLATVAMLASYFPARRAASVNPTEALRAE